jgi:Kef-type K+ transport system membrane component KefB
MTQGTQLHAQDVPGGKPSLLVSFLTYTVFVGLFVAAILTVLHYARGLPAAAGAIPAGVGAAALSAATLRILLVQIVVTLLAAYGLGIVARRLGQPSVIGELAGGIVLGPTILGHLWPGAYHSIFPADSLGALKLLAEVGVVFFMFSVGLEVDLDALRKTSHRAVIVSHASIAIPFLFGVLSALALHQTFAPAGTSFVAFALFTGIAMSITAFPVLARILTERQMSSSPLGTMALTCAAVDDITAWGLLSLVVAIVRGHSRADVVLIVVLTTLFAAVMLRVVRPLLARTKVGDATLILLMFASACITEAIGIHAVFGAFLAGVVAPLTGEGRSRFVDRLSIVTPALLPLFFAYVGVRTELTLIHDVASVVACVAIVLVATAGKLGGSAMAARVTGVPWRDALALGVLMNTRGLMELIAVNIAYDLGILTKSMFAILVVMALVATIATGPLLDLLKATPSMNERVTP